MAVPEQHTAEWRQETRKNRYGLLITIARNELHNTRSFISEDNPWGCTEKEVSNWKKYRKAWMDIVLGDKTQISFSGTSDWLIGVQQPNPPPGWCSILKQIGEVPHVTCRVVDLDIHDPLMPADPMAQTPKEGVDPISEFTAGNKWVVEGEYLNTCDYDMTAP